MADLHGSSSSGGKLPMLVLAVLSGAYIFSIVLRMCITVMTEGMEVSFTVPASGLAVLSSASMLGYALMQIPAGIMTDTLGGRRTMIIFLLAAGGATVLFGVAGLLGLLPLAAFARFITGLSISLMPPCVVILAVSVPPERFAQALGLMLSSGALGIMLATSPLHLAAQSVGWINTVMVCGLLGFILAFALARAIKDDGGKAAAHTFSKRPASSKRPAAERRTMLSTILPNIVEVLKTPLFWPMAAWQMLMTGTFFVMSAMWWVRYIVGTSGITQHEAALLLLLQALMGMFLVPLLAALSDKIRARKPFLVAMSILAVAGSASMILLAGKLSWAGLFIQCLVFGMGTSGGNACLFACLKESFPTRLAGTATGCCNMLYPAFAAIFMPIFGYFADREIDAATLAGAANPVQTGYANACWILAGATALGLICSLLIKESGGRQVQDI